MGELWGVFCEDLEEIESVVMTMRCIPTDSTTMERSYVRPSGSGRICGGLPAKSGASMSVLSCMTGEQGAS